MASVKISKIFEVSVDGDKKPWIIRNAASVDGKPFVRLFVGDPGFCRFVNGTGRNGLAQYSFSAELRNLRNLACLRHLRAQDEEANGLQPDTRMPDWSKSWSSRVELGLLKQQAHSDKITCVPLILPEIVDCDAKTWGPIEAEVVFTLDKMAVPEVTAPRLCLLLLERPPKPSEPGAPSLQVCHHVRNDIIRCVGYCIRGEGRAWTGGGFDLHPRIKRDPARCPCATTCWTTFATRIGFAARLQPPRKERRWKRRAGLAGHIRAVASSQSAKGMTTGRPSTRSSGRPTASLSGARGVHDVFAAANARTLERS